MSEIMTGGDAMIRAVLRHGVDTVFGLPGVQTYPIFDALQRQSNQIQTIGVRHEQAAAYMAMGYAKATGRPGVCSVVPGPGVLNAGAALLTAVAVNAPVMLLTGQVPAPFLGRGRGHLHELPDQPGTLGSFIKWSGRAARAAEAPALIDQAFGHMLGGRPGPVAVEMCWDTMAMQEPVELPALPAPAPALPLDDAKIAAAVSILVNAKRPLIMVGSGAQHASAEVTALAEALGAGVTAFRGGRGVVDEAHELGLSSVAAYELWDETDVLIGIGSRCEMPALRWSGMTDAAERIGGDRKLIRIEIEAEELLRLVPDVGIVGDAALATRALVDALSGQTIVSAGLRGALATAKQRAAEKIAAVQPHISYLQALRAVLPTDGILVKDICQTGFTSYFGYPVHRPRTYLTSGYQGNLGFALPTALGAKVGCPDAPVVCITGDGGFMFAAQELSTAAQHGIALVTVVFNNGAYGNVRRDQMTRFDGRVIASDLPKIDYLQLAEAQGVAGERVNSPAALQTALKSAIDADAPRLIEVLVDRSEEVSPWPFIVPNRA
ncbi:thiamine pyrophosphate-binding protein [Alphaproteobacteria bacterium]|nr:thiamine pyrophosphate-binding protein [Alphaproteobacteria bacterium]